MQSGTTYPSDGARGLRGWGGWSLSACAGPPLILLVWLSQPLVCLAALAALAVNLLMAHVIAGGIAWHRDQVLGQTVC